MAQGQFGRVYCAIHRASGQLVALKAIDSRRSTTSQFLRELSSLVSLRHPHLTRLRAIEHGEGGRYLVLDYAAGGTLRQLLEAENPPHLQRLLPCLIEVLAGLAHAHGRGIVHCDVKPENILIDVTPQGWQASLTDFGIARSNVYSEDVGLAQGGSPAYMAPERFEGQAYPASDLYGVGIILYEVLVGDRPFHGRPSELREAHLQSAVPWPETLALGWRELLAKALAKDPHQRFASAQAMGLALERQLATLPGQSKRSSQSSLPPSNQTFFSQPMAPGPLLPWPQDLQPQCHGPGIQAIAVSPESAHGPGRIWLARGAQLLSEAGPWLRFPEPVTQLAGFPNGGFAMTRTALYRWRDQAPTGPKDPKAALHCWLQDKQPLSHWALAPDGRWGSVLRRSPDSESVLIFRESQDSGIQLRSLNLTRLGPVQALLILDGYHGVAIAPDPLGKTQLGLFSRRGPGLAIFPLKISIHHWVRGQQPYELWALEAHQPQTLLRIQLKPFHIERWPLAIVPQFIQPYPWGCWLANSAGQLLALDRMGLGLGLLQMPLKAGEQLQHVLAMDRRQLLLATDGLPGACLHRLDWTSLGLPLIF